MNNNSFFGFTESITNTQSKIVSDIMGKKLPWQEKWKPKTLDDAILPLDVKNQIYYQLQNSGLKNATFHAGPGVGKTTVAKLIAKEMGVPYRFYNASKLKIDTLTDEIIPLGQNFTDGVPTIIILDECDRANSTAFWDALRHTIDSSIDSLRFILTGNYIYNIPDAILSRCPPLSFQHNDQSIKIPIFNRLKEIAETETKESNGTLELDTLKIIARKCYPDIRRMINEIERNFDMNQGSIKGTPMIGNDIHMEEILKYIVAKQDVEARLYFNENITDYGTFFVEFCDFVQRKCDKAHRLDVGYFFAEYQYRSTSAVNQEMNITRGLFYHLIRLLGR